GGERVPRPHVTLGPGALASERVREGSGPDGEERGWPLPERSDPGRHVPDGTARALPGAARDLPRGGRGSAYPRPAHWRRQRARRHQGVPALGEGPGREKHSATAT